MFCFSCRYSIMTIETFSPKTDDGNFRIVESLIQNADSGLKKDEKETISRTIFVTPELASEFLKFNNPNNRITSPGYVTKYAKLMKEGKWGYSLPLVFSKQGMLIDGQHRLSAIIESEVTVRAIVTIGVPEEMGLDIDRGRRRTPTHVSQIAGNKWTTDKHTGTARYMTCRLFESKTSSNGQKLWTPKSLTPDETIEILSNYEEGIRYVVDTIKPCVDLQMSTVCSVIAKAYYARPHELERIKHFCVCLANAQAKEDGGDNAALLLADTIREFKAIRKRSLGANWSTELHSNCIDVTQTALDLFIKRVDTYNKKTKKSTTLFPPHEDLFALEDPLLN